MASNRNTNNKLQGRRGRRRARGSRSDGTHLPMTTPPNQNNSLIIRAPRLYPTVAVARFAQGLFDVTTDGINPTFYAFNFSFNDVPGYSELATTFQFFCIEQIEIWWRPEYTVLSDASALSNSVNVEFNSAIDLGDTTAPTTVNALLEYQSTAHTSITTTHYRKFKPVYLISGVMASCGLLATSAASTNWLGMKVALNPTGVAMVFRSTVKFKIALSGLK